LIIKGIFPTEPKGANMPRRREVPKRETLPSPKFGNVEVAKFMNVLMLDGKSL
jgi:hypothetical protein